MNEWIGPGLLFAAVSGVLWTFYAIIRGRLATHKPAKEGDDLEPYRPMFGRLTPALAGQLPMSDEAAEGLQKELVQGGFYQPGASQDYRAARAVLVVVPLIAGAVLALVSPQVVAPRILAYTVVGAILGYSLPRVYLAGRMRYRARRLEYGLPLTIDLLALCLSAGQNLLAALEQVSRELRLSHPIVAQELAIARQHAELHSLEEAMKMWAARAGSPEVTNLALVLIQSEQLGTDAATTLQEMSNNLRTTARQRAEGYANRTSFWMLLPTIFCFWLAAAIVLIGPPYVDFFQKQQQSTADMIKRTRENLDRANRPTKLNSGRPQIDPVTGQPVRPNQQPIFKP
jgi:tight adherence protein C